MNQKTPAWKLRREGAMEMDTSMIDAATGELRAPSVSARAERAVMGAAVAPREMEQVSIWERAFSFPALLGALLVAGVFVARRGFDVDPDLWWHIKAGQDI